ncbi:MAG: Abi family protein [Clostridia bacterium]|nr:Abi family protein [Clostridia bacterium]
MKKKQISDIEHMGFVVENRKNSIAFLKKVNYYSLSEYISLFLNSDGKVNNPGIKFQKIQDIFEFDMKMRDILFPCIHRIELCLRKQLSSHFCDICGPTGYWDLNNYESSYQNKVNDFIIKKLRPYDSASNDIESTEDGSGNESTSHGNTGENNSSNIDEAPYPIWEAIDKYTIKMLSVFYESISTKGKKSVLKNMGLEKNDYDRVVGWLYCLSHLRNDCAHFSRLYGAESPSKNVAFYQSIYNYVPNKKLLFGRILVLKHLYPEPRDKWNNGPAKAIESLVNEYLSSIELDHIGFPEKWATLLYWN